MARTLVFGTGILLLSLLAGGVALAKAKTAKLTVSGPGISQPIELTHQDAISAGVWSGTFIDRRAGPVEAPSADIPRYMVQFHVNVRVDELRMVYVVYYAWDAANGRALVQLPAVEDEWSRLNDSTIARCCRGQWYYATDPWGQTIRAALPPQI